MFDGDFAFTVTNVLIHGVPYLVLTLRYGDARASQLSRMPSGSPLRVAMSAGFVGGLLLVVALAFGEELLWDRWVWHERPWLFGRPVDVAPWVLGVIVPLLSLPQLTHYVLDAFIWRSAGNEPRREVFGP